MPDLPTRLRTRDQNELLSIEFTPTAGIPVSELDEIDGAVEFVLPTARLHFVLPGINLYERSGRNEGIKCVILKPDVPTKAVAQIHLL